MTTLHTGSDLRSLMDAALQGDPQAWANLVDRFNGKLWGVAWSHRLDDASAHDVIQIAWMRFLERGHTVRDPQALGAWLAAIVRNESRRLLDRQQRSSPSDFPWDVLEDHDDNPFGAIEDDERRSAVRNALRQIGATCQEVLRLLIVDPPLSYNEIAAALDRPVGSIGATRQRCINRLREILDPGLYQTGGWEVK